MDRMVFENPPYDEFDSIVLFLLLIIAIALGSLPLLLLPNGLIWSISVWSGTVLVMAIGFWSSNANKLKFIHIEESGVGLQFKNGKYRRIDWDEVKAIRPLQGDAAGKSFFIALNPFIYKKEDEKTAKDGLLLLRNGTKYRISWQIAEAIHEGYYEITGRWPI